jgi:hypothetical protein
MGQTTDEIESQIENEREELKSNLEELETRVKSVADWRSYYRRHTGLMVGAAFVGGILLSTVLGKRDDSTDEPNRRGAPSLAPSAKHHALENWDAIAQGLVGTAATKLKDFISEMDPGFAEHIPEIKTERPRNPTH